MMNQSDSQQKKGNQMGFVLKMWFSISKTERKIKMLNVLQVATSQDKTLSHCLEYAFVVILLDTIMYVSMCNMLSEQH